MTLTQPIFEGFQNINAIRQAKATVQAGREGLRATEQTTLLNAATAYVDVVRDQAVVRLRQTNVDVLTEQLRQTKDRFNVGEVTRTDVAQAEARRSDAITQLYAAQANLKTSRATYEQVIGHPPSNLVHPPSIVHLLPSQLEDAMTLSDGQNPFILAAVYQEEASLYNVSSDRGRAVAAGHARCRLYAALRQSRTLTGAAGLYRNGPRGRAALSGRRRRRAHPPGQGDQQSAQERGGGCEAPHSRRGDRELGPASVHRLAN